MGQDIRDRNLEFSTTQTLIFRTALIFRTVTLVDKAAFFNVTFYAEIDGLKVLYLGFVLDGATPSQGLV